RAPLARISRASRTGAAAASTWKVTEPAPASTYWGAHRSGASIIRWQSSGVSVARASDSTTGTPRVRLGTKWLSMTSTWSQSAPRTASASAARLAKSADRMLGLICTGMPQACHAPGPSRAGVPGGARGASARACVLRGRPGCVAPSPAPRTRRCRGGGDDSGPGCRPPGVRAAGEVAGAGFLGGGAVPDGAVRPEADRRAGQRRGLLAARFGRVDAGAGDLRGLPARADPRDRDLRAGGRADPGGPGAD